MPKLLGVFLIFSFSLAALSQEFRRKISLDWEPIPEAKYYDVEIKSTDKDSKEKPKTVLVESASWTGRLALGGYSLRVRGRDRRKVPGDWSENQDFFVYLETPVILTPKTSEKILATSDDNTKTHFSWKAVPGAKAYLFELTSKDGKFTQEKNVSAAYYDLTLPVAAEYTWKVSALGSTGINSEGKAMADFSLWGKRLAKPTIVDPRNAYVRELDWDRPIFAENFEYQITRFDPSKKQWVSIERSSTKDQEIPFSQKLPGGKYKLVMKANANLRQSSPVVEKTFQVMNGNRSPAAEEIATLRESIDHTIGWFGIASYLITSLNYSGVNSDKTPGNQLGLSFSGALGGTGRVGLGFLSPKSAWGFLGIVDYSGIVINNNISNYASGEGNAIYRSNLSDRSEIRQQLGLFYKEYPAIIGSSASSVQVLSASTIGPHYGVEYWQAMTSKLGFQVNAHGYLNAMSINTPNGQPLETDISYQLGFLGSYRLSRNITGLAGYAFRNDSYSYQATDGSTNRSTLTGNYLNLFLEWAL